MVFLVVASRAVIGQPQATLSLFQVPPDENSGNPWKVRSLLAPDSTRTYFIDRSTDLREWEPWLQTLSPLQEHPLPSGGESGTLFLRQSTRGRTTMDDWSSQLVPGDARLFSTPTGVGQAAIPFAKFTLALDGRGRMYFQDSDKYPFHFGFARERIPGLIGIPIFQFDRLTLYREGQQYLLGSVLQSPNPEIREMAVQFSAAEAFAPQNLVHWYLETVSRIAPDESWGVFYMPSLEQLKTVNEHMDLFTAAGITVIPTTRWISRDVCYSGGWALGRLVWLERDEISSAWLSGRITSKDILITDGIPAEIPRLAGVLTTVPATPNSHVALQAEAFGIPFGYIQGQAARETLQNLGHRDLFLLIGKGDDGNCSIRFRDVTDVLTEEEKEEIRRLKDPEKIQILPVKRSGTYALDVAQLKPGDIDLAGGKAANFGSLRRMIPDNSPHPALALTFDVWLDFLEQPWRNSPRTIREVIREELSDWNYPPDTAKLHKALYNVRKWIDQGRFTSGQQEAILAALSGFDPLRKIRFRSSTNVEDSDQFIGAGLYDSYSGCLADDLDDDDDGPSHCDPFEENERGVFRAIRRVYASFYNDSAVLERMRHGISEDNAGMAVMVHYSFPDEDELANGVIRIDIDGRNNPMEEWQWRTEIVSQPGASPVTNPDNSALPEVAFSANNSFETPGEWTISQWSSILGEGQPVHPFPSDYAALGELAMLAAGDFIQHLEPGEHFKLDYEYKRMEPGKLIIKQIRRIPTPRTVPPPDLIPNSD